MKVFAVTRQSSGRGKTEGDSVKVQLANLRTWCDAQGYELVGHSTEQDVSGGLPFAKRPGLMAAIEAVETGAADMVVARDLQRLFRNLDEAQIPFVKAVERAGGQVMTLSTGQISRRTAGKRLTSTFLGAFSEYEREVTAERVRETHEKRVAEGKWVGRVPIGYDIGPDGRLVPNRDADAVRAAFEMRDKGASFEMVRAYLREATGQPIPSLNVVQTMTRNPAYVGSIVRKSSEKSSKERGWPDLVKHGAHQALVPEALFRRVSGLRAPRGKRPQSDRLLARLGVLKCSQCGSRMVVATGANGTIPVYRCPPGNDCTRKQGITARFAEEVVVRATRIALREAEGRAGGDTRPAEAALKRAEEAYESAIELLAGHGHTKAAKDKLAALLADVERAQDALERAKRSASFTLRPGLNWDELTLDERRDLIRAVVATATVEPGKGAERVKVKLVDELAEAQRVVDKAAEAFKDDVQRA
jgi:DNA invertase Pin-like site-specific DNA recombinase